jgi:hypothetical protein
MNKLMNPLINQNVNMLRKQNLAIVEDQKYMLRKKKQKLKLENKESNTKRETRIKSNNLKLVFQFNKNN